MPKFSKTSLKRLETCEQPLQALFYEVIKICDCTILCGHRNQVDQAMAYEEGRSKVQWPNSTHNLFPSQAVDVAPYYDEKPHIRWTTSSLYRWYFFGGIVLATAALMDIPIRWGGDWDRDTYLRDQRFNDLPHYELIL